TQLNQQQNQVYQLAKHDYTLCLQHPKRNLKLCTCPECNKKTTTSPNGESIFGCWVHKTTLALASSSPLPEGQPTIDLEDEPPDFMTKPECIKYVLYVLAWLSLVCGVSQSHCWIARDWVVFVIKIFCKSPGDSNEYLNTYKDVQTIAKRLGLDPKLDSCTCCPKCFNLYEPKDTPTVLCGESLFKLNCDRLPSYQPVSHAVKPREAVFRTFTPRLTYHTQSFDSWLHRDPFLATKSSISHQTGNQQAPKEPHMTAISHILAPLVDELLLLNTGTFVRTPQFPDGRKLSIHLGALIGDVVTTHKITGFASHAATYFCSWCKCQKNDIKQMHVGQARASRDTQFQAIGWRDSNTLAKQKCLLKLYGTRWPELNRLPYGDPVKNVVLGIMHNWYEGVLQHCWRVRWAFEPEPSKHVVHGNQLDDWEDNASDDSDASFHFHDSALLHIQRAV
ncbi:hypothetical protein MJO29_008703, partial [Puccinia striiformis f. sp. tritici]